MALSPTSIASAFYLRIHSNTTKDITKLQTLHECTANLPITEASYHNSQADNIIKFYIF